MTGEIVEALRNGMFRIQLDNGHETLGYTAGKMRRFRIRMNPGDRVRIELSAYDLDRGRIVYRLRPGDERPSSGRRAATSRHERRGARRARAARDHRATRGLRRDRARRGARARSRRRRPDEVARRQALTAAAVALLDAAPAPVLGGIPDVAARSSAPSARRAARPVGAARDRGRCASRSRRSASLHDAALLAELLAPVDPALAPVADEVDRCIEEDGSDVRDTASPLLRSCAGGAERRRARARGARTRRPFVRRAEALQEPFLAERGGRPVLAVRASSRSKVPGIVHDASSTGQTLFVEPFAVVELNNRLAEAAAEAREEAERILRELSTAVAAQADALVALVETTGASTSRSPAACFHAPGAARRSRSPTTCGCSARGIRCSTRDRGPDRPRPRAVRALVISGPNTGGKTVALKTLGLAALLHQCGLRPPADAAALPVFDNVLADIGDRQSIEMSLSTFSGHLRTLVEILDSATARSLVLLDEVAAGTDPEEGSALAQALVARLARQARLTVVTTHYAELKEWASANDEAVERGDRFRSRTDEPLYRVELGRPGPRTRCASRSGSGSTATSSPMRARGSRRSGCARPSCSPRPRRRSAPRSLRARVERGARPRPRARGGARAGAGRVRASADRARAEAVAEAERELAEARAELSALRDELRARARRKREPDQDRALGAATERATRAERALGDLGGPLPQSGRSPRATRSRRRRRRPRHDRLDPRREAEVVGATGQRVRIPVARLRPSRERAPEDRAPAVQVRAAARGDASDQLDVRGLPGQEAREQVRRLVDDAALAGLLGCAIVHGRGTGALRKAVREELASHPLVERMPPTPRTARRRDASARSRPPAARRAPAGAPRRARPRRRRASPRPAAPRGRSRPRAARARSRAA